WLLNYVRPYGGIRSIPEDSVKFGARVLSSYHRYRRGRLAAVTAAALAALLAVPATAAASQGAPSQGFTSQGAAGQPTAASCPWVSSRAPVAQRVAQLMGQMSLDDEI